MAKIKIGRIGMILKGAWVNSIPYDRLDVVTYDNSSYVCLVPNTNVPPTNNSYWQIMARKGVGISNIVNNGNGKITINYDNGESVDFDLIPFYSDLKGALEQAELMIEEENIRQLNETLRLNNENIREQNELSRIQFNNAIKVFENYSPSKSYVVGNKVAYLGSSYYCIQNCTNILPTNTSYWIEIAKRGESITNVVDNGNGTITVYYPNGSSVVNATFPAFEDNLNSTSTAKGLTANQGKVLNEKISDIAGFVGYTDNDIYGVEVDVKNNRFTRLAGAVGKNAGADFDNVRAFGGRRRCIITDTGVVLAYYGEPAYTQTGALTQEVIKNGIIYPVGTHVQVMVEQPKFYYRVVPLELERIEHKEINTLTVTAGATTNGDITVNLDGVNYTIPVVAGDTTTTVATKIRSTAYTGWTTGGTGAVVIFMANTIGERVTATFNGGSTGVTATVEKTLSGKLAKGYHLRKARYYVSDYEKSGFKLHPAFIVNGVEKEYVYLSAFEGSLYDVSTGTYILDDAQIADFNIDKLCSIANAKPISGLTQLLTRANVRKLAQNRGAGWQQAYIMTISATQMLFLIEYASFNMQTSIGIGVTNKASGTGNESELTGATTVLGNASGSVTNINGFNVVTYRGEENIYGNIFKFADGMNIYAYGEHSLYIADNSFGDNISTAPYKDTGLTLARTNGYVSAFAYNEEFDWLFIPSETIGNSSLPVGDYFYQNHTYNGWLATPLGGYWTDGSAAGGFYWYVYDASSHRARLISGRLVYVPS